MRHKDTVSLTRSEKILMIVMGFVGGCLLVVICCRPSFGSYLLAIIFWWLYAPFAASLGEIFQDKKEHNEADRA